MKPSEFLVLGGRYKFLEEAFEGQKGIIESFMAKLHEKRNFVQFSANQVQSRYVHVSKSQVGY